MILVNLIGEEKNANQSQISSGLTTVLGDGKVHHVIQKKVAEWNEAP